MHPTVNCVVLLLIPALDACFRHQRPHFYSPYPLNNTVGIVVGYPLDLLRDRAIQTETQNVPDNNNQSLRS